MNKDICKQIFCGLSLFHFIHITKTIFDKKKKFIFIKLFFVLFSATKKRNDERMKIVGESVNRLNKQDKQVTDTHTQTKIIDDKNKKTTTIIIIIIIITIWDHLFSLN